METTTITVIADMFDVVIGIDPHKHTHTAAFLASTTGKALATRTAEANPSGFSTLMSVADAIPA